MNWKLLGYDGFLTKAIFGSPPPPSAQQVASGSIKTRHLYGGAVTNEKIDVSSRTYQAIVSTTIGDGNFRDIQQAINHVHNEIGYGKILIRNGSFDVSSELALYSNIWLEGESPDGTILDFGSGDRGIVAIGTDGSELQNIRLENFTVKDSNSTTRNYSIYFEETESCRMNNLRFDSNAPDSADIYVLNSSRTEILNNYFKSNTKGGISLWRSVGYAGDVATVMGNHMDGVSAVGISSILVDTLVTGNTITTSGTGVSITRGIVANNIIKITGASTGIHIYGSPVIVANNNLDGTDNGTYGIFFFQGQARNIAIGNKLEDWATDGIYLAQVGANGTWENIIAANVVTSSAHGCTIAGNLCTKNQVFGNLFRNGFTDNGVNTQTDGGNITA